MPLPFFEYPHVPEFGVALFPEFFAGDCEQLPKVSFDDGGRSLESRFPVPVSAPERLRYYFIYYPSENKSWAVGLSTSAASGPLEPSLQRIAAQPSGEMTA